MVLLREKNPKWGLRILIRFYIALNLGEKCFFEIEKFVDIQSNRFSCELGQIGGSFERKKSKVGAKNLIRFYIALNLGEKCFFEIEKFVDIQSNRFW